MSFRINWPDFSPDWVAAARAQLTAALNKGGSPPANLAGPISVEALSMGTKAPELEVLEVGELEAARFRGIFKLVYDGDGSITLGTRVQANPLGRPRSVPSALQHSRLGGRGPLAAHLPLVVPMDLTLSELRLRGIAVLVLDAAKGVTLSFKSDPLESIRVRSTFDGISTIRALLQQMIEEQLRKLFEEDLPSLVHNLSLLWVAEQQQLAAAASPERRQARVGTGAGHHHSSSISSPPSYGGKLHAHPPSSGHRHAHSQEAGTRPLHRSPSHLPFSPDKWSGNEEPFPAADATSGMGTILYKSISTPTPQEGLGNVFGHPLTFSREQVIAEDDSHQHPQLHGHPHHGQPGHHHPHPSNAHRPHGAHAHVLPAHDSQQQQHHPGGLRPSHTRTLTMSSSPEHGGESVGGSSTLTSSSIRHRLHPLQYHPNVDRHAATAAASTLPTARERIVLTAPGANEITAQLSNLINANRSIAPPPVSLAQEAGHVAMRTNPATAHFGLGMVRGGTGSGGGDPAHPAPGGSTETASANSPGSAHGSQAGGPSSMNPGNGAASMTPPTRTRRRRHLRRHVIRLPSQLLWQPLGSAGPSSAESSSSRLPHSPPGRREEGAGRGAKERSQSVGGASIASHEDAPSLYTVL